MQIFAPEPEVDEHDSVVSFSFERGTVREKRIDIGEFRLDLYRAMQQIDRYLKLERLQVPKEHLEDERRNVALLIGMVISLPRSVRHEHHGLQEEHENLENPIPLEDIPGTWALPIQELANFASVQFPDLEGGITENGFTTHLDPVRLQELRDTISDAVGESVIGTNNGEERPSSQWLFPPKAGFDPEPNPPVMALSIV
jgi:hypothetical protein